MLSQESQHKYVWRKEDVICVEFYREVEIKEDSKVCIGFKDTKNIGDQNKRNFTGVGGNPE